MEEISQVCRRIDGFKESIVRQLKFVTDVLDRTIEETIDAEDEGQEPEARANALFFTLCPAVDLLRSIQLYVDVEGDNVWTILNDLARSGAAMAITTK